MLQPFILYFVITIYPCMQSVWAVDGTPDWIVHTDLAITLDIYLNIYSVYSVYNLHSIFNKNVPRLAEHKWTPQPRRPSMQYASSCLPFEKKRNLNLFLILMLYIPTSRFNIFFFIPLINLGKKYCGFRIVKVLHQK